MEESSSTADSRSVAGSTQPVDKQLAPESTGSGEITFQAGNKEPVITNLPVISEADLQSHLDRIGAGVRVIDYRTNSSGFIPVAPTVVGESDSEIEIPSPENLPQLNTVEVEEVLQGTADQTVQVESGKETLANKRRQTPLHIVYPTEPGGAATHPELDFKSLALIRTCNPAQDEMSRDVETWEFDSDQEPDPEPIEGETEADYLYRKVQTKARARNQYYD
jgi:hypothetical protein